MSGSNATWALRLVAAASSEQDWARRQANIRTQVLVAAGLWPEIERAPLRAEIFGRIVRDGYTVEKVRFATWPGLRLTGNLYRPSDGEGPHPAVLSAHGHWPDGRFQDDEMVSEPARAITLARMGFVVFSYDMVGFGDLDQIPHAPLGSGAWGVNLLGLQLWDSIRAIDFLVGLPDVDPKRIGITGASGGGTQTFLLAAVDDRIACSAPVNMVSADFQGGCECENAPGLRIDLTNAEIAAAVAPKPLLLVTTTGDWTATSRAVVAPLIQQVYASLAASDRFRVLQFDFPHNYNRSSREAVYAWFAQWLRGAEPVDRLDEPPFQVEKVPDLSVKAGAEPPDDPDVDADELTARIKGVIAEQLRALAPRDRASLARFRELMTPALRHTTAAEWPAGEWSARSSMVAGRATLVVAPTSAEAEPLLGQLRQTDDHVEVVTFNDGDLNPELVADEVVTRFRTTYLPTRLGAQVRQVVAQAARLAARDDVAEVRLVGIGAAGIPTLLARALAPSGVIGLTIIDLAGFDGADESAWQGATELPGILRIGGLTTAAMLSAPGTLVLHGTEGRFAASAVERAFALAGSPGTLRVVDRTYQAADLALILRRPLRP